MSVIVAFFLDVLPWFVFIFPIYAIIRYTLVLKKFINNKTQTSWKHELECAVLCLYVIFILASTVLPEISTNYGIHVYYPGGEFSISNVNSKYLNLIPGNILANLAHSFQYYNGMTLWISLLGNIMLFLPLGLIFSLSFNPSIKVNLLIGAFFSLSIEIYQLFLPRTTDIDDLILNVLGMFLGCLFARFIMKYRNKKS